MQWCLIWCCAWPCISADCSHGTGVLADQSPSLGCCVQAFYEYLPNLSLDKEKERERERERERGEKRAFSWRASGHVTVTWLTRGEPHHVEYLFQLVVVVGTASLHILLSTVEDRFKGQKLSKDASNGPDICHKKRCDTALRSWDLCPSLPLLIGVYELTDGLGVVLGSKKQLWSSVPKGDHHRIQLS